VTRAEFLNALIQASESRAGRTGEKDALAALPDVESRVLRRGALGIHEELSDEIAPLFEAFLDRRP
jgi:hypothetical protein